MKKNPIEVYDPNLLVGCHSMDMPSVRCIIRSVFDENVKGNPYSPIRTLIESLNSLSTDMNPLQIALRDNVKTRKDISNIASVASKTIRIVFDDKSFVGSQIEIIDALNWSIIDLEKHISLLNEDFKRLRYNANAKDYIAMTKKIHFALEAFIPIKKQFKLLQNVAKNSYNSKMSH